MPDGGEDRLMSPYVAREVGLVETKSMARRVEAKIPGRFGANLAGLSRALVD